MNQPTVSDGSWIEQEAICEDCRAIDFSPVRRCYTQRTYFERGSSQATVKMYGNAVSICNVGSKYRVPPSNGCVLCLALFDQRRCHHVSESSSSIINEYLIALPITDLRSPAHGGAAKFLAEETPVLLILSASQPSDGYILSSSDDNFWGKIANERDGPGYLLCRRSKPLSGLGSDRPAAFCKDSILGWLRACEEHHKCKIPNQSVTDIHLIDCDTQQVISATSSVQYLALSYVWGQAKTIKLPERNTSTPICALPRELPRCISDAMDVTRALGFRYLWVDQLCIDQANPERKHQQIRSMSLIYGSAQITLVAAAGENSDFGLPHTPSWPQKSDGTNIDIGEYEILSTQKIGRLVAAEAWSSRAWTYQEGFSSRRLLIFTRSGIYYECSDGGSKPICRSVNLHGRWLWEGCVLDASAHSQYEPLLEEDNVNCGPHTRNQLESMNRKMWNPQNYQDVLDHLIDEYFTRLEVYTNRHLSHQSDILIAFAAAVDNYRKLRINTDMLPHLDSEACISRTSEYQYPTMHGMVLFGSNTEHREHTIVRMLSFRHGTGPSAYSVSRRPGFPSWSWAGWLGRATWAKGEQAQLWTLALGTSYFPQAYLGTGRASLAKLQELLKARYRAVRDEETGIWLPDDLLAVKERLELKFRAKRIPGNFFDVANAGGTIWKWELFGRPAEIHMSVPITADDLRKYIKAGTFELVLLGYKYRPINHELPKRPDTQFLTRANFGGFDWFGVDYPAAPYFEHAKVEICCLILTASRSRPSALERIGLLRCSEVLLPFDFPFLITQDVILSRGTRSGTLA